MEDQQGCEITRTLRCIQRILGFTTVSRFFCLGQDNQSSIKYVLDCLRIHPPLFHVKLPVLPLPEPPPPTPRPPPNLTAFSPSTSKGMNSLTSGTSARLRSSYLSSSSSRSSSTSSSPSSPHRLPHRRCPHGHCLALSNAGSPSFPIRVPTISAPRPHNKVDATKVIFMRHVEVVGGCTSQVVHVAVGGVGGRWKRRIRMVASRGMSRGDLLAKKAIIRDGRETRIRNARN